SRRRVFRSVRGAGFRNPRASTLLGRRAETLVHGSSRWLISCHQSFAGKVSALRPRAHPVAPPSAVPHLEGLTHVQSSDRTAGTVTLTFQRLPGQLPGAFWRESTTASNSSSGWHTDTATTSTSS